MTLDGVFLREYEKLATDLFLAPDIDRGEPARRAGASGSADDIKRSRHVSCPDVPLSPGNSELLPPPEPPALLALLATPCSAVLALSAEDANESTVYAEAVTVDDQRRPVADLTRLSLIEPDRSAHPD